MQRLIVTGKPRPEVKWSKDGESLQQSDRIELRDNAVFNSSELSISDARVEDSGMYSAEAVNVHGSVKTTAVVEVTESVQKTSEKHRETTVVENTTETVEKLHREDTKKVSVKEDTVRVAVTEKKKEKEMEAREETTENVAERVEIVTDSSLIQKQRRAAETEKFDKAEEVVTSEAASTQFSAMDYAETKESEVTSEILPEDAAVIPEEISTPEGKVQGLESPDIEIQETVPHTTETAETSVATETKIITRDVTEKKSEDGIKSEHEVQEVAASDSLVEDDKEKGKPEGHQDVSQTSQSVEDKVFNVESRVNFEAKESTTTTSVKQTEVAKEEEKVVEISSEKKSVGALPILVIKPVPTTVDEGEALTLMCVIAQQPHVEITWSKDGRELDTTGRAARIRTIEDKMAGTYLLEVAEMTSEDVGEYTFSAESEAGVISCPVSVSVIAKLGQEVPQLSTVQETEPLESVDSEPGLEESGRQEDKKVLAEILVVATDQKVAKEPSTDQEISAAEEKLTESSEEGTEVNKDGTETSTSAETATETSTAAGVRTVISKETITKKKKKSKDKQGKTSSDILEVTENVEEVEKKISTEAKKDNLEKKAAEEMNVVEESKEDKKIAAVEVAAAEVEVIEGEYSKEEFEGPLPVIEVKPVPTSVNATETVRLACKVAKEPTARIHWSKNGQRLEASSENGGKINIGVDAQTGMHFLEIVEASQEDIGEYTLTAESEGGIVSCTVSVDVVVSDSEVSSALKQISQRKFSEKVSEDDKLQKEETKAVIEGSKVSEKAATAAENTAMENVAAASEAVDVGRELQVSSQSDDLQQLAPLQQTAVDSEVTETSTESLGKVKTGEVVATESSERHLPRAREAAPAFVSVLHPVFVEEGSAVRLQCRVEG